MDLFRVRLERMERYDKQHDEGSVSSDYNRTSILLNGAGRARTQRECVQTHTRKGKPECIDYDAVRACLLEG